MVRKGKKNVSVPRQSSCEFDARNASPPPCLGQEREREKEGPGQYVGAAAYRLEGDVTLIEQLSWQASNDCITTVLPKIETVIENEI